MEELIKPEVGWKEKKRATEAARQERENQLYVRLLMASVHFVGAFLSLALSALWQSMQMPAVAAGLWNAACALVFIGAVAVVL
jgi:hypothetical protein